jgi:AAA15 family ATPase/GTPase
LNVRLWLPLRGVFGYKFLVSSIECSGFRNLHETIEIAHPLAVLVGPNNAGKSNVVDALRMVLTPLVTGVIACA